MTSRERRETQILSHDGRRRWKVTVKRQGYAPHLKSYALRVPEIHIYPPDDGYYAIEFTSRARLQGFIRQLQALADEVWPQ